MPCVRHLIVCEGESEHAYLQRLQSFLDAQPLPDGTFETPIRFIGPMQAVAKTGAFGKLKGAFNKTRKANKTAPSIQIWADFDLYQRNDCGCADEYAAKTSGIPDFLFSFHNFEDFLALHSSGSQLAEWLRYGSPAGRNHFAAPLHSKNYEPEIERIFPGYRKGTLSPDFISWASLQNLKANLHHQPSSNPRNLQGIRSFAEFLIDQIEQAYPDKLSPASVSAAAPQSSP
jgi:hypothetical protein